MHRAPCIAISLLLSSAAQAGVTEINLADYRLTAIHLLSPSVASEASAVTYNWDTDTLFILGDEGDALAEYSTTGQLLSSMTLTDFADVEGVTYIGEGRFVIVEERLQDLLLLNYVAGGSASGLALPTISLGPSVGNIGLEGASFDPISGTYIVVKEVSPQAVREATIDWVGLSGSMVDIFTPNLGVLDLSDVQVLTTVPSLVGTPFQNHLLLFSQESRRLLLVSRAGDVLSIFDFTTLAPNAEGVTIGPDGTIYIVGETPALFVLSRSNPECPADIAPAGDPDGTVNVADLLAVITTWGACGTCPPVRCPADIAPIIKGVSTGDCQINVADLLAVITSWGACR